MSARFIMICAALGVAALAGGCQSDDLGESNRQIPAAQGGLPAPPALAATEPAVDDDIIIDDSAPRLPLAGGYAPADANDVGATAAEKLALDEIYRREPQRARVESVTRELQVVAGINYRFVFKMSGAKSYRVVVYRPLDGDMRITSFEQLTSLQ